MLKLMLETREKGANLEAIRKGGRIPAVLYGKKEASASVTVSEKEFNKVYKEAGESSVIILAGLGEDKEALIHDVDIEPVRGEVRHADFYVIEKGKKVTVSIPLEFEGTAPAEKLGGALMKVLHEIEIEAFPKDLPHELVIDVTSLTELDSQILVSDVKVPAGVTVLTDGDEVVALVSAVKEEEETPQEAPDLSAIEVAPRGKKEEEEVAEE